MREYSVEVARTQVFVVKVMAESQAEAVREAWNEELLDETMPSWETLDVNEVKELNDDGED